MLVLGRKKGEKIKIGDNITVSILSHEKNQTRIGIEAPCDVPVHREEVYQRIHQLKVKDDHSD